MKKEVLEMKEQNKRFYSTILLLVGALFVVVFG